MLSQWVFSVFCVPYKLFVNVFQIVEVILEHFEFVEFTKCYYWVDTMVSQLRELFLSIFPFKWKWNEVSKSCIVLCVGSWWPSSQNMECDRWTSAGNAAWCISGDYRHCCQHRQHTVGRWQHRQDSACVVPADHSTCKSCVRLSRIFSTNWHASWMSHSRAFPRSFFEEYLLALGTPPIPQIRNIREIKRK
jgi:hypothetical protein